jgi:ERF superfamily
MATTKTKTRKPRVVAEVSLPKVPKETGKVVALPSRVMSEGAAFIAMIERAARDPKIDVSKLKELLELRDREREQQAVQAFAQAMVDAQAQMEPIRRDMFNPVTKSRYASYAALDRKMRPIYSRNGFGLTFNTEPTSSKDFSRVLCDVMHAAGHVRHYQKDVPIVTEGAKGKEFMTLTHASISADTYGMRDLLRMIFNIATTDDDGNAAAAGPAVSPEQLIELEKLIEETQANLDKFCAHMRIAELPALPASRFEEAKIALRTVAKKAGRA